METQIIDCGFDIVFKSRIRLYGIDTPESRTRDLDEKARGKMASKFLEDNISKAMLEKIWVNNGKINKRIHRTEKIPEGFVIGKIFKSEETRQQYIERCRKNRASSKRKSSSMDY